MSYIDMPDASMRLAATEAGEPALLMLGALMQDQAAAGYHGIRGSILEADEWEPVRAAMPESSVWDWLAEHPGCVLVVVLNDIATNGSHHG